MRINPKKKMITWMVCFAAVLCVVGFLMQSKLMTLSIEYVSNQVSNQAATLSRLVDRQISSQLDALNVIAYEVEQDNAVASRILNVYTGKEPGVAYGILALDGRLIGGDSSVTVSSRDFSGVTKSFRGNPAASYCKGKGFLLSTPIYRNKNVRYVLYKLYDEESARKHFDTSCYDGKCYTSIRDEHDEVVVGSSNRELAESEIWKGENFNEIRGQLKDLLNLSATAAVRGKVGDDNFYFFMADLSLPGLSLVGMVPEIVAAKGVKDIAFLIFWVFGLLLVLFVVGFGYLIVSEKKALESDSLREAKYMAENASKAKSQFLANMSHEIRTPINGILGMDTMLLKECKDPQLKEYALNIQSAGNTLLSLINDVLDISKIESGKMEIVPVEYSLFSVLNDCYNMVAMRARDKSLSLNMKVDPTIPVSLVGDEVRIRQVINNLLSNAVKYTAKGGVNFDMDFRRIPSVDGSVSSINLVITVKDTGIGIREEDMDKLFQSFRRLELERNRNVEGTGLGLNLTKHLVELMKGTISVQSQYGVGSTFTVTIPQVVKKEIPLGDFSARYHEMSDVKNCKEARFRAPKGRILVVDDVPMNLRVMKGLLKETDIQIDVADNGMEALEKIKRTRYDVIFLDHMMPVMDGVETLSVMKTLDGNPNEDTPVIMLTANAIVGARDSYMKAGFTDYLTKPVREDALLGMLLKYLPAEVVEREVQVEPDSEEKALAEVEPVQVISKPLVNEADLQEAVQVEPAAKAVVPEEAEGEFGNFEMPCLKALSETGFVDVGIGLGYCMKDESFYVEMLEEYCSVNKADALNEVFVAGDFENYRIQVHALKSTSLTIGAIDLSSAAKSLEFACKDGKYDFVKQNHEDFVRRYNNFVNVLKEILDGRAN
ncbi:MAG: ATP-binding protein [Fibrobacter sp.]|nr:ATP-binding protein [Fibrobacter sp.]